MAQSTFEKTMRNISLNNKSRRYDNRNSRRSWQFKIDIDLNECTKLWAFMRHELEYYNTIVNGISSRMRTMPEVLLEAHEDIIKLYLACAETGFDPYKFFLMRNLDFKEENTPQLPIELEPFRKIFFGVNSKGERKFTDRIALMCQLFSSPASIHHVVRRNMAEEIIDFFKINARIIRQTIPSHLQADQIFKTAPQTLEIHDIIKKRHLQMPKNIINVMWNDENEVSYFKIPYYSKKIVVPSINFADGITNWNYVILHQNPGTIALSSTPWILDVRNIQNKYLLKYTDVNTSHTGSAFYQAKRGVGSRT